MIYYPKKQRIILKKMNYTEIDIENIKAWLQTNLDEERYLHSLGVMDSAVELAKRFNQDEEKAKVAGLLHDCAKCFSKEKLKDLLEKEIKDLNENEFINSKTLHAPVSAYIAEKEFKITDQEILSAIRWHTLGKIEMTDFEKVVFIADKIEKNTRESEYRDKIVKTLEKTNDLDKTLLKCFRLTIKSLVKRKLPICQQTIDVYNELILKTK